jgi:hypothetical protein
LTLRPAEILGVSSQLGSIEVGKIANLTVTRGDLFDAQPPRNVPLHRRPSGRAARVRAYRNGRRERLGHLGAQRQPRRLRQRAAGVQRRSTSNSRASACQELLQGQLGSGQLATGTATGSDVNFTVPVTLPAPASQTTDAIFTGTISGNQMMGTVQIVGRGSGTFTGARAGGGPPAGGSAPQGGTQPPGGGGQASAAGSLTGIWSITTNAGPRAIPGTFTLQQQGERLTGQIETPFGTGDIANGSATGNGFRISTTLSIEGQATDITFEGTVNGNQMSGTVTSSLGSFPFTGTRNP